MEEEEKRLVIVPVSTRFTRSDSRRRCQLFVFSLRLHLLAPAGGPARLITRPISKICVTLKSGRGGGGGKVETLMPEDTNLICASIVRQDGISPRFKNEREPPAAVVPLGSQEFH